GDARHGPPAITQIEGDPDHPISQGALCSKGAALKEFIYDPKRLSTPLYRARPTGPARTDWREVTWEFAIDALARRIKETRDSTFIDRDGDGRVVNRLDAIAFIGGAADTNEMNYLAAKAMRSLGLVYLEQQSRMGHAASAHALAATVGLSGMMT